MKYAWTIRVRPDQHLMFHDNWAAWTNILARHPDHQGAHCYRTAEPDTYLVIAEWVSKQGRDEATREVERIPWWTDNSAYGTVTDLGWLEDGTCWEVGSPSETRQTTKIIVEQRTSAGDVQGVTLNADGWYLDEGALIVIDANEDKVASYPAGEWDSIRKAAD